MVTDLEEMLNLYRKEPKWFQQFLIVFCIIGSARDNSQAPVFTKIAGSQKWAKEKKIPIIFLKILFL